MVNSNNNGAQDDAGDDDDDEDCDYLKDKRQLLTKWCQMFLSYL